MDPTTHIGNVKFASTSHDEVLPYPPVHLTHTITPVHMKFTLPLGGKKYTHFKKEYILKSGFLNAVPPLVLVCHLPADFSSLPSFLFLFCVFCASLAVCANSGESTRSKL